jgi:hypothetical protein
VSKNFDSYWKNLVDRVYHKQEVLRGAEGLVYRLTCIYGETMVDGIEAYFERRWDDYEQDIAALQENGFADIAADFAEARRVLLGDLPLTEESINPVLDRLLKDGRSEQIDVIYDRLIDRLPELLDRRDEIGVANGLFEEEGG